MQTKALLRKETTQQLQQIPLKTRVSEAIDICEQLIELMKQSNAKVVMAYVPYQYEVDIEPFLAECWIQKKTVLLPKIVWNASMAAVRVFSLDQLDEGSYGIQEPLSSEYRHEFINLIIVPGVAFDKEGNRLWRGKWYYDNFLKKYPESYKVWVGFSTQLKEYVPTQSHDIKMDEIIAPRD